MNFLVFLKELIV